MAIGDANRQQMLERAARDQRRQWGWGPSYMASEEEEQAYRALELQPLIESGQASIADLPEAYGGRPQGSTRRAIRAQVAWDAQQEYLAKLEEEKRKREAEILDREAKNADRFIRQQEFIDKKEREFAIKRDAAALMNAMRGVTLPDGTQLRPINPSDPDAIPRLEDLATTNKYGLEDPAAKTVWDRKYSDAQKFVEKNMIAAEKARQDEEEIKSKDLEQQRSWLVKQQEEAASLGLDTSGFFATKVDPETQEVVITAVDQVGLAEAIGIAKRNELENKNKEIEEAKVSEEIKGFAKTILSDIDKIDAEIRKNNFNIQKESNQRLKDEYLNNIEFLRGERDILEQRFNKLIPQQKEEQAQQAPTGIPQITSKEELDSLPSGAEYIAPNGKRYLKK